jgi:hypothetical protein
VREIKPPCATPHFGAVYVLAFAIGALWKMQQSSKVEPHRKIQAVYLCALPILVRTKLCAAHSAQRS